LETVLAGPPELLLAPNVCQQSRFRGLPVPFPNFARA
jgi:hypothetical protein